MMKTRFVAIAFALALACGGSPAPGETTPPPSPPSATPPEASPEEAARFADASNRFAVDLWSRLPRGENAVVSPASVSVALAMTWGGAGGETAAEMARVLHFEGEDEGAWHRAAGAQLARWNAERDDVELSVANRLFGERGYAWGDGFLALTRSAYGAPLEPLDFSGAPDDARETINAWVEAQTNDRIRDLLPPSAVTTDTRMVLTNAVYLHADWASPFEREATRDRPFYAPGGERSVPTMHQTGSFRYAHEDGVKLLAMPYRGGALEMLVVLPDARDGLTDVEASLDPERLARWAEAPSTTRVEVALPKLRVEPGQPLSLGGTLSDMGMPRAFDPARADFTPMADPGQNEGQPLSISAVVHKAFIAVDEQGTEAAAATAVVVSVTSMPMPQPSEPFVADHPFLYLLRDTQTGAILFMGRVVDPSAG